MLAPSGTVTCFSSPASVFTVRLFPLIAVTEPMNRGACANAIAGTTMASAASHQILIHGLPVFIISVIVPFTGLDLGGNKPSSLR